MRYYVGGREKFAGVGGLVFAIIAREIVNWKFRSTLIGSAAALVATIAVALAAGPQIAAAGSSGQIMFKLQEFKITPRPAEVKAGSVLIKARNVGVGQHELVVARTTRAPDNLPTDKLGSVKEGAINVIGEVSETQPGKTGQTTLNLKPGKYVMFCNVAGHYSLGMRGRLIVK